MNYEYKILELRLIQTKISKTYKFSRHVRKPYDGQLRTVVENLPKENQSPMVNQHTAGVLVKIQSEDQSMFLLSLKQWFSKYCSKI